LRSLQSVIRLSTTNSEQQQLAPPALLRLFPWLLSLLHMSKMLVLFLSCRPAAIPPVSFPSTALMSPSSLVSLFSYGIICTDQICLVTRNQQTARQIHLHRGCYPFWYPEPRGVSAAQWQQDVDNRIRFGLKSALDLNILKPGSNIIAVQGWKGGSFHTNTMRILTVPTDMNDLAILPLTGQ
jgi:hypothetical protein